MGLLSKRWLQLALVAGWVVWAGGCATPAHTANTPNTASPAAPAQPPPQRQSATDKRFIVAPELERILRVVSVSLANPPGTFLKIQVNFQNLTQAPQRFRYRLAWFDKDGEPLPLAGGAFVPWMLLPGEASSIAATAPTPTAADFGIAFVPDVN